MNQTNQDNIYIGLIIDDSNIITEVFDSLDSPGLDDSFQFIYSTENSCFVRGEPTGNVKELLMQIVNVILNG